MSSGLAFPCSDGAGEVLAIGSKVTRFRVGDRVVTSFYQNWIEGKLDYATAKGTLGGDIDGTLTTHRVLHEDGLIRVPEAFEL